jgi:molybdate transport system permease protein
VFASAVAAFPLFLLPARGAFEGVDPALEDAARLLGRRELSVFTSITLPLAWRGLAAGAVLAFARALGDFGATLMVAGDIPGLTQTASLAIYDAVQVPDAVHAARALRLTLCVSAISIASLLIVQWTLPAPERRR